MGAQLTFTIETDDAGIKEAAALMAMLSDAMKTKGKQSEKAEIETLKHQLALAKAKIKQMEADQKTAEPDPEPEPEKTATVKRRGRKPADTGKIRALHHGGRSVAWIADDMNLSENTVRRHLREMGLTEGR